ncbi:PspC domain-containing protein [Membranihabitans maritimus]|uniref:PspC domain-containing protein n=1 Tax=Membranihabitans maritimus TaxID=2904244 RepID=UPI001F1C2EC3|nr:PspC domain-containing protein [Membranihabitans maritimus]
MNLRDIFEKPAFGVCSTVADQFGLAVDRVRIYFVYLSLLTFGSPVVIYLFVAFWINWKKYIQGRRPLHYL